jgi:hypothetical protein
MSSSGEMALVPIRGWRFTSPGGVVLAWENLEGAFAARPGGNGGQPGSVSEMEFLHTICCSRTMDLGLHIVSLKPLG